ncbi:YitT family protein [Sporosarcina soli]|uniref:YitT family protein n=1 Tax=Sporosarcina soli TaxID=334736 RepID=A0ABW0TQR6_9BACL
MKNNKIIKDIAMFVFGLFAMGLGVALVTKSQLGTSPITSVPYVLSMIFPLSIGLFVLLICAFFLLIQIMILKKDFQKKQYLQLLVGPLFGLFTDLGMYIFSFVTPTSYMAKIIALLLGCIVLAYGIYLQISAKVIVNPGEGLVIVIAQKIGKEFGIVKIVFDFTLIFIALAISLYSLGSVQGVREGTIISAFLVGYIIRIFNRIAQHVRNRKLEVQEAVTS